MTDSTSTPLLAKLETPTCPGATTLSSQAEVPRKGVLPSRASSDRPATPANTQEGSGGGRSGTQHPTLNSDADSAWARLVEALIERHGDELAGWFGCYRLAHLAGSTLTVYLLDFAIRNVTYTLLGNSADLSRTRYGDEFAALWREHTGDEGANLVLSSGRP